MRSSTSTHTGKKNRVRSGTPRHEACSAEPKKNLFNVLDMAFEKSERFSNAISNTRNDFVLLYNER